MLLERRIRLEAEQVELTSLVSVKRLARRLRKRGEQEGLRIDALVCNAGIGGWEGFDMLKATWGLLTDLIDTVTYPRYKTGGKGWVTKPQMAGAEGEAEGKEEGVDRDRDRDTDSTLGEVFTANVFGHYLLAHDLVPLMSSTTPDQHPGRIVWVSSIEAYPHSLDLDDLQGLHTTESYESSKRLTDVLVLSSELPSTQQWVSPYLSLPGSSKSQDQDGQELRRPKMYLSHPGVCGTSIAALPKLLEYCMFAVFYVARLLGSPWHCVSSYLGAVSVVWLALTPAAQLEELEHEEGKAKWGSACDVRGDERVIRTEVSGWGWGGRVGEVPDGGLRSAKGRWRGMRTVSKESREEFEETGRKVWRAMEELRVKWESRLEGVE